MGAYMEVKPGFMDCSPIRKLLFGCLNLDFLTISTSDNKLNTLLGMNVLRLMIATDLS
jgi:hypothetical protein